MSDEPNDMLVHCGKCSHEWFALKLPMLLEEACRKLSRMRCPKCDAAPKNVFCGPAPVDEINTSEERVKNS